MKLIVGLGNPGDEYALTRHNIGRRLIEFIASREKVRLVTKKPLHAALASVCWEGEKIHLSHPLTYMNLSGEAVFALVKYWKLDASRDLLIVVDDAALPFGKFRLRGEGSTGGHNGLASIESFLKSREYPRLRIGIGAADTRGEDPLRDHVLSPFRVDEEKKIREILEVGYEASRTWVLGPLSKAMNRVNTASV